VKSICEGILVDISDEYLDPLDTGRKDRRLGDVVESKNVISVRTENEFISE